MGECEEKLKNVTNNKTLYVFKLDVYNQGMKIPKLEYEIYYQSLGGNLTQLNLSICEHMKVDILSPVILNGSIDKYNSSSDYYNDICHKTTLESGTDISLKDRKNEFVNNNMTVCEENCKFIDYDYINSKAKCRCEIKISLPLLDNITFDKNRLYDNFKDFKNIANLNLLKCYKQILTIHNLKKNYGFIIFFIHYYFFSYKLNNIQFYQI